MVNILHNKVILTVISLLLLVIGGFLLLVNIGVIPVSATTLLRQLWPLTLVGIGLTLITNNNKKLSTIAGSVTLLITTAIVVAAAYQSFATLNPNPELPTVPEYVAGGEPQTKEISVIRADFPETASRNITVRTAGTNMEVIGSYPKNDLMYVKAKYIQGGGEPSVTTRMDGKTLNLDLTTNWRVTVPFTPTELPSYVVAIGESNIPSNITIIANSGKTHIQSGIVTTNSMYIGLSGGELSLDLSRDNLGSYPIKFAISGGIATVNIPTDSEVRLTYGNTLGHFTIDGKDIDTNGNQSFSSENYGKGNTIGLDLDFGVTSGTVNIVHSDKIPFSPLLLN